MAVDSQRWRGYGATRTGASHTSAGRPAQDALAIVPPPERTDDIGFTVIAVADGHGHPRHFRSGRGSQFAVEVATEIVRNTAPAVRAASGSAEVAAVWRARAGSDLLDAWRDAVARDVAAEPITAEEQAVAGLRDDSPMDEIVYGYGATLIVAVVIDRWLLTAQIGDGDLFVIAPDGRISHPLPADHRLDGSRTTSLCQPDALDSLRFGVDDLTGDRIAAVMLATDGYGNAQARDDWDVAFGSDIVGLAAANGVAWINEQIPRWAERCASSEGSGDDVTLAMLFAPDPQWHPAKDRPVTSRPETPPIVHRDIPEELALPEELTLPMAATGLPAPGRPVSTTDPTVLIADVTVPATGYVSRGGAAAAGPTVPATAPAPAPAPAPRTNDEVTMRDLPLSPSSPAASPERRSHSVLWMIGGIVLLVLVGAAIVYYLLGR